MILLMPGRVRRDTVINRSRWYMVGSLGLIGTQFLIQYITHLRTIGITQAVLVNLAFLLPASVLMNLSILNLQRQGQLSRIEKWIGAVVWILVMAILAITVWSDGHPLEKLSDKVRVVEICLGLVYGLLQLYYTILQFREFERMQVAIENYYDRERRGLTRWMKHAIGINGLLAIFVPVLIFAPDILLKIFALLFFWAIFMMWFSFVRYFTSNAIYRVREAEENAREEESDEKIKKQEGESLPAETMQHINHAVDRWIASGAYLKTGITSPMAADAMNIPRYQLTAWVKDAGHDSFTRWITSLRVEEAKQMLRQHPEWTNEAIADHCGFSRAYFQKIFKKETGLSPTEFSAR